MFEGCGPCITRVLGGRAFATCTDETGHAEAAADCGGMFLASIRSAAEADLDVLIAGRGDRIWIGIVEGEGRSRWADGSTMTSVDYGSGGAKGGQDDEDCGVIEQGAWEDEDCEGVSLPRLCATP